MPLEGAGGCDRYRITIPEVRSIADLVDVLRDQPAGISAFYISFSWNLSEPGPRDIVRELAKAGITVSASDDGVVGLIGRYSGGGSYDYDTFAIRVTVV